MKNIILTLLTSVAFSINAQEVNPFESIGKEGKILTLSKGKYTEVHINDSLQRIGSVIVNMNTGTIYELLNTDTLYSEATLDPTVMSRWYSTDPKANAKESPYASMGNNPIIITDPLGDTIRFVNGDGVLLLQINQDKPNQLFKVTDRESWENFVPKVASAVIDGNISDDSYVDGLITDASFVEVELTRSRSSYYQGLMKDYYDQGYEDGITGKSRGGSLLTINPDDADLSYNYDRGYNDGSANKKASEKISKAESQTAPVTLEENMISIKQGSEYTIYEKKDDKWEKRNAQINEKSRKAPEGTIPYEGK